MMNGNELGEKIADVMLVNSNDDVVKEAVIKFTKTLGTVIVEYIHEKGEVVDGAIK